MKYLILFMSLLLTACATGPAQKPPPPPVIVPFADNKTFMLFKDMVYPVGQGESTIFIPKGFVTDFASVPKGLWSTGFSPHGLFSRAAIIHDYLYWAQVCTRIQADNIMLLVMKGSGVGMKEQVALYQGVKLGGEPAWNENKADREAGKPRVVPLEFFNFSGSVTWDDYEKLLIENGVKDPAFPDNPDYCSFGDDEGDYGTHLEQFLGNIPLE